MKIEKETLQKYKAQLSAGSTLQREGLLRNQQRQVVEFALELIQAADGGPDIAKLRQELAEKENNLKLILTDLQEALETRAFTTKTRYIVNAGLLYLRFRKTKDVKNWADYRVMIDEEFGAS
jgi:hypothetical protein